MEFKSFAKINIGLRVVGKRDDGFHNIETFFQQIDVFDTLAIDQTKDGTISITTSDPACPTDDTNLAYRAAAHLKKRLGNRGVGCRIHIKKRIPMGGGLGGGSSNAATTLNALNQMWRCNFSDEELQTIGLEIGSDVPFFIKGGFALGEGRGELLTHIQTKFDYHGLLLCPGVHIPTVFVYNNLNLDLTIKDNFANFSGFIPRITDITLWKKHFENDLTTVVFKQYPEFQRCIDKLYMMGAFYAHMSGSGSTLFGLFESPEQAQKAGQQFKRTYQVVDFRPLYL